MLSKIYDFFSSLNINKYVYISVFILILTIITFITYRSVISQYQKNYQNGYEAGVISERNKLNEEYKKALEEKIKENTQRLTEQFNNQLEYEKNNKKIEIEYVDRVKEVVRIVKDSNNLNKKECSMSDEEFNKFNELTRSVK